MSVDEATRRAVDRLNDAINGHDLDALMAVFSEDCVFENTGPRPDGQRFEGQAAVRGFWERWFAANPDARFETEDIVVAGDRCVVRWVYRKLRNGEPWHLRGVDVFKVRNGRVTEKLAYTKG
jgi:ketosteroid isomerase-like protein